VPWEMETILSTYEQVHLWGKVGGGNGGKAMALNNKQSGAVRYRKSETEPEAERDAIGTVVKGRRSGGGRWASGSSTGVSREGRRSWTSLTATRTSLTVKGAAVGKGGLMIQTLKWKGRHERSTSIERVQKNGERRGLSRLRHRGKN